MAGRPAFLTRYLAPDAAASVEQASGRAPIARIEAGYAHSVAVIMADEALLRGARMVYDPQKREIREG